MQRIRKLSQTFGKNTDSDDPFGDPKPQKEPGLVRKLSNVFNKPGEGDGDDSQTDKSDNRPRKLSISSIMSSMKGSSSQTSLHRTTSNEKLKLAKQQEKPNHRMVLQPGQHSELKHCKSMPFQRPNRPTYKGGQPLPKDVIIRPVNTIDLALMGDGTRASSDSGGGSSVDDHSPERGGYGYYSRRRLEGGEQGLTQSKSAVQLRWKTQPQPQSQPQPGATQNDVQHNAPRPSETSTNANSVKKTAQYLEKVGQPLPIPPHLQKPVPPVPAPRGARSTPSPLWDGPTRAPPRQQIPRTPPFADFPSPPISPISLYSQDSYRPSPGAIDRDIDQTERALAKYWPPTPKGVVAQRQLEISQRNASSAAGSGRAPQQQQQAPASRPAAGPSSRFAPSTTPSRSNPPRAASPEFYSTPPPLRAHPGVQHSSGRYPHVPQLKPQPQSRREHPEPQRHQPSKLREITPASRPRLHTVARTDSSDSSHSSDRSSGARRAGSSSAHRVPQTTKISTTTARNPPPPPPPRTERERAYVPPQSQSAARPPAPSRAYTIDSSGPVSRPPPPSRAYTVDSGSSASGPRTGPPKTSQPQPQPRTQVQSHSQTQPPTRFSPFAPPTRSRAPASETPVPLQLPIPSQVNKQLPPVLTSQAEHAVTVHHSHSFKARLAAARVAEFGVIPPPANGPATSHSRSREPAYGGQSHSQSHSQSQSRSQQSHAQSQDHVESRSQGRSRGPGPVSGPTASLRADEQNGRGPKAYMSSDYSRRAPHRM